MAYEYCTLVRLTSERWSIRLWQSRCLGNLCETWENNISFYYWSWRLVARISSKGCLVSCSAFSSRHSGSENPTIYARPPGLGSAVGLYSRKSGTRRILREHTTVGCYNELRQWLSLFFSVASFCRLFWNEVLLDCKRTSKVDSTVWLLSLISVLLLK